MFEDSRVYPSPTCEQIKKKDLLLCNLIERVGDKQHNIPIARHATKQHLFQENQLIHPHRPIMIIDGH